MARPSEAPTWLIQLTSPGRGAIATLRVEGPGARAAVEATFCTAAGHPLAWHDANRMVLGRSADAQVRGEPVVVRWASDEVVHLHCHGGLAAVARIESAMVGCGCRRLAWRDWIKEHHTDRIQAAAREALADAPTQRTAAILLDQYDGALRRELDMIRTALADGRTDTAQRELEVLLRRAALGRHLVEPWRVVLAGRPNVGKSSLMNAMLGYRRAIVHHAPGTTRDALTASTAIDGWPVELGDTAGLRHAEHPVERAGVDRAQSRLAQADLVILVFDVAQPWSTADQQLLDRQPSAVVVHNKADLPADPGPRPPGMVASALTGHGVETVLATVSGRLVPEPPPLGAAVPFTAAMIDGLQSALDALHAGDPTMAASRLAMR